MKVYRLETATLRFMVGMYVRDPSLYHSAFIERNILVAHFSQEESICVWRYGKAQFKNMQKKC